MSIIEKAFNKLSETRAADRLVEQRRDEQDALPLASTPPELFAARLEPVRVEPARHFDLDLDAMLASSLITPDSSETQVAEEYRLIKRPLLMKADAGRRSGQARHANLIMVTSSVPGEGKTFSSINLAMSMAMERDRTVLLVDTDVARGDVSQVLGIEPGTGLTDLLTDEDVSLSDALISTNVPKLTIMPAGRRVPNLTELFASEAMRKLAVELSEGDPERVVIFDSPPLLAATGASVLPQFIGQIVMVVEAERTQQGALEESLRLLEGVENVGLVLNKCRQSGRASYYGYGTYGT